MRATRVLKAGDLIQPVGARPSFKVVVEHDDGRYIVVHACGDETLKGQYDRRRVKIKRATA